MQSYFALALAWVQANPVFATVVLWPIVTAIFTALFRHRSPDELARLPKFAQYIVRFVAYTGLDSASLVAMLRGKLFPSARSAKPGTTVLGGVLVFALFATTMGVTAFAFVGCAAAQHGAADTGYTAEQAACAQNGTSRDAIDMCRANVNKKYGVVLDAGAPVDGGGK